MGFFDLKAICSICNKEVGLNRFKIKKDDAWICPECFKKAGGSTKVNCRKNTISDIKSFIEEIQEKNSERRELIKRNPMTTAEGMYDYCLKNNFGSGYNEKWGIKHFKIIEDNLMQDEEVKMTFIGLHNYVSATKHDNNFAYAITNKRIMMAQKKSLAGENFQTVSLKNINDITLVTGVVFGVVTIDTIKETFNIGVNKERAKAINYKIHSIVGDINKELAIRESNRENSFEISVADELKKYKELLDEGVLTLEEFEKQKQKLLDR